MTSFAAIQKTIKDGDITLWRPTGMFGRAICAGSGSQYAHAGMLVWIQQPFKKWRLCSMDMIRGPGGVMQPLDRMVERWPGTIDVYQANPGKRLPKWDGDNAAGYFMDHFLGLEYGEDAVRVVARTQIPILRWLFRVDHNDEAIADGPPFCSHAVAAASYQGGGVDPVPNRSPAFTWPGDLANSTFYELLHEELTP